MPYVLPFFLTFFLFGCVHNSELRKSNSSANTTLSSNDSLPISPQVSMLENRTIYQEDKSKAPEIAGKYELETGTDNYKNVTKAYMNIEKINDQNFGYYYAVQDEKSLPNGFFGIFRYRDGKFLNKVFDSEGVTTLNSNITLITEGQRLKLVVLTSYGKRIIIWSRVLEDGKREDKVLHEALADAKISYTQIYKEKFDTFTEKEGY